MFTKEAYKKVTGHFHLSPFAKHHPDFIKPFCLIIKTNGKDICADTYKDLKASKALPKHVTFTITKVEDL